jgi:hypothetical protein
MTDEQLQRLRAFEADHSPDGWPAIQMRDVSALISEIERLTAENEAQTAWKAKIIKSAEDAHGPAAFRFKLSLNKRGTASNEFPNWLDGRWVSFVYAEDDAHIGLHAKIEELRDAVDKMTAEVEALRASAQGARKLLKRTPPATRSMYVGTDKEPWGKQAAAVAKSLEAAMKGQTP